MNTEQFQFKLNDPIVAEDIFGTVGGFYKETVVDKNNIYIRFVRDLEISKSKANFIRSINVVRPSTVEEVNELNRSV